MPFIVETGAMKVSHPGIKLYVTEANTTGRRKKFILKGVKAQAFKFPTEADASNAAAQFSSMYGLVVVPHG